MTIATDLKPNHLVAGPPKTISLERMRGFSGWPRKDIHTDEDLAKANGLPGPIASGTMSEAYLVGLMIDVFGDDWLRHGSMQLTFVKIVQPGDIIVARGRIEDVERAELATRVTVAVWCENQRGEHVVAGTAWGRLTPARDEDGRKPPRLSEGTGGRP
jgi:hypothetical protein